MLLAGQNKYWGTVEQATKFWQELGINHIMIKLEKDIKLVDQSGEIIERDFKRLHRLQKEFGVKYHLHPYNLIVNNVFMTPSIKSAQPVLSRILTELDRRISEYELYPLLTFHLPRFADPEHYFGFDEKIALENSINFFKKLKLKSRFALETMHDPYRNPGHALLGFKAKHFVKLIGEKKFGLCIDVGHLNMAKEPLNKFLKLPYPIFSVHLHGNDGSRDQHQIPTRENVGNFEKVIEVLKRCDGPVVFEIHNYDYTKEEMADCIRFWKEAVEY